MDAAETCNYNLITYAGSVRPKQRGSGVVSHGGGGGKGEGVAELGGGMRISRTGQCGKVRNRSSCSQKFFVYRRGLGKMWHLEIRDLRLQKEVTQGKFEVRKVAGYLNPADLMTKTLTLADIKER